MHGHLAASHGEDAQELLARLSMVELSALALKRALEPFLRPVPTVDALHLASLEFLHRQRLPVRLATYDFRMEQAAAQLGLPLEPLA